MTETMTDKAKNLAIGAMESIEPAAGAVAEKAGQVAARVDEVSTDLNTALRKSLDERPMATLAIAAGLGVVLGALWKR